MIKKCLGACLDHCYKEKRLYYIFIGFIIGLIIYYIIQKIISCIIKNKKNDKKKIKINN